MNKTYESEAARTGLARRLAAESMVLLKNEGGLLPLPGGKTVALLGQTQLDTIIGGGGSGASFSAGTLQIRDEMANAGLILEEAMDGFYRELDRKRREESANARSPYADFEGLVASGLIYEIFGQYSAAKEEPLPDDGLWQTAAKAADTAIVIIGRATGGEECDRRVENDYYLTPSEKRMLELACGHFENLIAVFNCNGMVDMSCTKAYPQIKAAIFMGTAGEQAAGALADLITGRETPSGKLSQTAALCYEDYPTAKHFSYTREGPDALLTYESYGLDKSGGEGFLASPVTVYQEDIYVGYRYFDSFQKPVLYPFGFGLSYAEFKYEVLGVEIDGGRATAEVKVTNTSKEFAGKEAMQLYVHAPFGELKKPWQELRAIAKTPLLKPMESCTVTLSFELKDMASFDEASMSYILEPGDYVLMVGTGSHNAAPAAVLALDEKIVVRIVTADIGMAPANKDRISLLEPEAELRVENTAGLPRAAFTEKDVSVCWPEYKGYKDNAEPAVSTLHDVAAGKVTMEEFIAQMTVRELAVLCNGYGPGLPFGGMGRKDIPVTIKGEDGKDIGSCSNPDAMPGYCNPTLEKYGIMSTVYKDGPASVGKTAWPTGMMIACTFDPELAYEFGSACGCEAEMGHVDSWLAPGMNLIRNPIEGRAFEYFSEDPFICGLFGTQVARGAIENNAVTVCPKHFAMNEQETYRRGSLKKNIDAVDTIVSARAARELYLRPFEMVVTGARPMTLMTSFNKVNGTFAAGNYTLCTEILRGEWGYEGVVVTDWGDMDMVVDGADAVKAGNDVIMPGGPPVIEQVLKGYEEGRVELRHLRAAAANLMKYLLSTRLYRP